MKRFFVNVACGDTYVKDWVNLDYAPHSSSVIQANLTERLPIADNQADVVYSSHFLEHIPRQSVSKFLSECHRIAKPGGRIRLVLPDLGELCRSYLKARDSGANKEADFIVLEMLDQCVRLFPGGHLGRYYQSIQNQNDLEMIRFVRSRTGQVIDTQVVSSGSRWKRFLEKPGTVLRVIKFVYCKAILRLLPTAFRNQNVSMSSVGERHQWIYDFYTLEHLLKEAGFSRIVRVSSSESEIPDFPFYPLDLDDDRQPRKGLESMYVEATKA